MTIVIPNMLLYIIRVI